MQNLFPQDQGLGREGHRVLNAVISDVALRLLPSDLQVKSFRQVEFHNAACQVTMNLGRSFHIMSV